MVFLKNFWRKGSFYLFLAALLYLYLAIAPGVGVFDWSKELAYFAQIKEAVGNLPHLPYYWWGVPDSISWYPAVAHSHIFIANPETWLFSPLVFLLSFMKVSTFVKLLPLIFFLIGVAGAYRLRQRLAWTDVQWRLFCLIFFFNPVIIQHFTIGYTPWLNLFLFPWLINFLLAENRSERYLGLPAVLAIVLLQGGSHVFVWFMFIILLYYVVKSYQERSWAVLREGLLISIGAVLLGWIRFYSTFIAYGSFAQSVLPGYSIGNWLLWTFVPPFGLNYASPSNLFLSTVVDGIPSWDAGTYLGLLPLLIGGFILLIKRRANLWTHAQQADMSRLSVIAAVFGGLSFAFLWSSLTFALSLGLLASAEKYSFRLFIPALLVLSIPLATSAETLWLSVKGWLSRHFPSWSWMQRLVWLEMIILIPLLWANLFWARLATINSGYKEPAASRLVIKPDLPVESSGRLLIVDGVPTSGVAIQDLLLKDAPFFDQYNVKALSSTGKGSYVLPQQAGEVGFVFRAGQFKLAFVMTAIFWSIWFGFIIARTIIIRRWSK